MNTIAVIGAGPAGLTCASRLIEGGKEVLLFDHRAPWEKPCGGILPPDCYRFIDTDSYAGEHRFITHITFVSTRGDEQKATFGDPLMVLSRKGLTEHLLGRFRSAGGSLISERIKGIITDNNRWTLFTDNNRSYTADIIVGADGFNSLVRRKLTGKIPKEHLSMTFGCHFKTELDSQILFRCIQATGYFWFVSAGNLSNTGIGAQCGTVKPAELRAMVDKNMADFRENITITGQYSTFVPSASSESFFDTPCCGENWIVIGDAAGHVDPIMCEGISYGMRSGDAAAKAILIGDPAGFDTLWRDSYGAELIQNASSKRNMLHMHKEFGPEMYGALLYMHWSNMSSARETV